ncbi:hypothetical protein BVC71_12175 [Marivivens niveibacter]|uniref:Uncharacterized protein n=1 Tax=Marivivens niveibacter TaxID=1930667 RepID=A0A251WWN1_9RHOB|nr:hypothetical protein [Marivivens niveibacter]OUD08681.1 hypothetical protein BVC71_12175 [Marivivens niveibacter]
MNIDAHKKVLIEYVGAAIALYGFIGLCAGWGLDIQILVRWRASMPAMVASTSFCFMLLGIGLMTSRLTSSFDIITFSVSLLWLVSLCGFELALKLSNPMWQLDNIFGFNLLPTDGMSYMTAMGFIVLSLALLSAALGKQKVRYFAFGLTIVSWAMLGGIGVLKIGGKSIPSIEALYSQMSYPTIVLMFLAACAIFAFCAERTNESS